MTFRDPPTHVPQRTCIGCRGKDDRSVLVRLVRSGEDSSSVFVDPNCRMPGRGAWLHRNPECLEMAVRRRSLNRAFRASVESDKVKEFFQHNVEPHPGAARELTVQCESGSEN
ncbi:YlxR family protein [Arthrobacter roseus]|uniref:YlxR family protein n=1 Tax=Arthrobacter roseus TaxID=136274 RepID=UPI0019626321|nr:YlxR family protein [Arthrobacter roseus]MBM7848212.1 putative RNA-binding protein YlxR (DUF448 family) [Arthrobacter roseus]